MKIRKYFFLFWVVAWWTGLLPAQEVRIASWNLCNFGKSKSPEEIAFIAQELRGFDLVAVQEVSTSLFGARAVAALADALDRTGTDWDYRVSDPTAGEGTERYAFLWKTARMTAIGDWGLVAALAQPIDREPYLARFRLKTGQRFSCATMHAVPTAKLPENEIAALVQWMSTCGEPGLVVMGDFNLAPDKPAFKPLKKSGFTPVLQSQKTSLKRQPGEAGEYLHARYDNLWFRASFWSRKEGGVRDFVSRAGSLEAARAISDHLPVWVVLTAL